MAQGGGKVIGGIRFAILEGDPLGRSTCVCAHALPDPRIMYPMPQPNLLEYCYLGICPVCAHGPKLTSARF